VSEPGAPVFRHEPFVAHVAQRRQHGRVRVLAALEGTAAGGAAVAVVPFLLSSLRGVGVPVRFEGAQTAVPPCCGELLEGAVAQSGFLEEAAEFNELACSCPAFLDPIAAVAPGLGAGGAVLHDG